MLIRFPDKCYEVVQKIKALDALDLYVAKDMTDTEQKLYTAACIRDQELARKLILITTKKNTSLAFKDLHESFNTDGKYYITKKGSVQHSANTVFMGKVQSLHAN